jgi:transposase
VQDYLRRADAKGLCYSQIQDLSSSAILELLGKGRQSKPTGISEVRYGELERELSCKGMTLALLWQEGIDVGEWQCSYGTFCRQYKQWRGRQQLSMRQVYQGGEKVFVDYCGMTVPVYPSEGGAAIAAQIFVACLGASNYTYAEATASQTVPEWIGSHQRAFAYFGGVPQIVVPDNLKSGVSQACHYEPGINCQYHAWAEHYGVAVIPVKNGLSKSINRRSNYSSANHLNWPVGKWQKSIWTITSMSVATSTPCPTAMCGPRCKSKSPSRLGGYDWPPDHPASPDPICPESP